MRTIINALRPLPISCKEPSDGTDFLPILTFSSRAKTFATKLRNALHTFALQNRKTNRAMCKEHGHHHHGCSCHDERCHHSEEHAHGQGKATWREVAPMAFSLVLLLWGVAANPLPSMPWLVFVAAYLPIGVPVIKEAIEEVAEGDIFNEFTLMILATAGAFAIGEYPEAVAVMFFYSVGEYFQDRAVGKARRDIEGLMSLRPDVAEVVTNSGERVSKKPEEVKTGETIEVKAGARVPLDGRLLGTAADFDTAALTGESVPRTIEAGAEVQAGMIAIGRVVRLEVTHLAGESALSRIMSMVEDAAQRKSHAEMFIRRFARAYTPVVIALAAAVAILPPLLFHFSWSDWLYRALVFLVISCPCALVVSIPLCYFRGIGVASRIGILFKGGNYLDAVTRIRNVVFDKTGTLTHGLFTVKETQCAHGFSAEKVLSLAAALEQGSTHPIARAIVKAAAGKTCGGANEIEEMAGLGIKGNVAGRKIIAGKASLLQRENVTLPPDFKEKDDCTYIYVAAGGQFAGAIALRDEPKTDAAETIRHLGELGVRKTCVLSGDRQPVVSSLAKELGIGEAHGDLMPADKAAYLRRIMESAESGGTAFVGDGINDAPVLAMSDVGFAMGGTGTDVAVETADIVLQSDSPSRVADAIRIGRKTRRTASLNIALSLGFKSVVLLLSALGMVGLWVAVIADTGVTLICVANTYLIKE